jgi:hypothetical protein
VQSVRDDGITSEFELGVLLGLLEADLTYDPAMPIHGEDCVEVVL